MPGKNQKKEHCRTRPGSAAQWVTILLYFLTIHFMKEYVGSQGQDGDIFSSF
jgi:hypothetical protein